MEWNSIICIQVGNDLNKLSSYLQAKPTSDASSQFRLGVSQFLCLNSDVDYQKLKASHNTIQQAAKAGFSDAQCFIGEYYAAKGDTFWAVHYLRQAVAQNNRRAQFKLAQLYIGTHNEENLTEALQLLRLSVVGEGNHLQDARFLLATCLLKGKGLVSSTDTLLEAIHNLELNCSEKHYDSQIELALHYLIKNDAKYVKRAEKLLQEAADAQHPLAYLILACLETNRTRAVEYLTRAHEYGSNEAKQFIEYLTTNQDVLNCTVVIPFYS